MWRRQVAGLRERRVVAIDLLGHGKSPNVNVAVSLDDLVTQVAGVLTHAGIHAATLVGFDLGGSVAVSTAATHPDEVAAVALVSTPHGRLKAQRDLAKQRISQAERYGPQANADSAIQRWFSAAFQVEDNLTVQAIREQIASNDPDSYLAMSRLAADADQQTGVLARAVTCPLVGHVRCAETVIRRRSMARHLAGALKQSKLMIVPRQRHMLPIEAETVVNDAVVELVQRAGRTERCQCDRASLRVAGDPVLSVPGSGSGRGCHRVGCVGDQQFVQYFDTTFFCFRHQSISAACNSSVVACRFSQSCWSSRRFWYTMSSTSDLAHSCARRSREGSSITASLRHNSDFARLL